MTSDYQQSLDPAKELGDSGASSTPSPDDVKYATYHNFGAHSPEFDSPEGDDDGEVHEEVAVDGVYDEEYANSQTVNEYRLQFFKSQYHLIIGQWIFTSILDIFGKDVHAHVYN